MKEKHDQRASGIEFKRGHDQRAFHFASNFFFLPGAI
jgi:hypothetical protein